MTAIQKHMKKDDSEVQLAKDFEMASKKSVFDESQRLEAMKGCF